MQFLPYPYTSSVELNSVIMLNIKYIQKVIINEIPNTTPKMHLRLVWLVVVKSFLKILALKLISVLLEFNNISSCTLLNPQINSHIRKNTIHFKETPIQLRIHLTFKYKVTEFIIFNANLFLSEFHKEWKMFCSSPRT